MTILYFLATEPWASMLAVTLTGIITAYKG
jgi:hypothetical protein